MIKTARNQVFRSVHGVIPSRFLLIPKMNTRNNSLRRIYRCKVGSIYNLVMGDDHTVVCTSGARHCTRITTRGTRRMRRRVTRRLGGVLWFDYFRMAR